MRCVPLFSCQRSTPPALDHPGHSTVMPLAPAQDRPQPCRDGRVCHPAPHTESRPNSPDPQTERLRRRPHIQLGRREGWKSHKPGFPFWPPRSASLHVPAHGRQGAPVLRPWTRVRQFPGSWNHFSTSSFPLRLRCVLSSEYAFASSAASVRNARTRCRRADIILPWLAR